MATSTGRRGYSLIAGLLLICWLVPAQALGEQPVIGVAPLAYAVPKAGQGLADLLALCIADCGPWQSKRIEHPGGATDGELLTTASTEGCDYILVGRVLALSIADRDQDVDLSNDLADLARQVGMGGSTAQVALEMELWSVADKSCMTTWQVDALESRKGTRLDPLTTAWMASADYISDEFRQTMIGRAAYKAVGEVLYRLIEVLPLAGQVLAVSGDAVVVDLGSGAAVMIGDQLIVLESSPIHSEGGAIAWMGQRRVAALQVLEVTLDRSLCLILDAQSAVVEGMIVRPLTSKYSLPAEADSP